MSEAPRHPGQILFEEVMMPLGVSRNKLARDIDVPVGRISDIVAGKRGITPDTALRFAKYFGTTPELWLRLQSDYDLYIARTTTWPDVAPSVAVLKPASPRPAVPPEQHPAASAAPAPATYVQSPEDPPATVTRPAVPPPEPPARVEPTDVVEEDPSVGFWPDSDPDTPTQSPGPSAAAADTSVPTASPARGLSRVSPPEPMPADNAGTNEVSAAPQAFDAAATYRAAPPTVTTAAIHPFTPPSRPVAEPDARPEARSAFEREAVPPLDAREAPPTEQTMASWPELHEVRTDDGNDDDVLLLSDPLEPEPQAETPTPDPHPQRGTGTRSERHAGDEDDLDIPEPVGARRPPLEGL